MFNKPKKNNGGFTLVELIIAVVILAIAVTPILHSFVTASSMSQRSQKMGEITALSQNIQETVKACSLDAFCSFDDEVQTMLGTNSVECTEEEGKRSVKINNLFSGDSYFDALVTFEEPSTASGLYEINAKEIVSYRDMNGTFAQSVTDQQNPDVIADVKFNASVIDVDVSKAQKIRNINITISKVDKTVGGETVIDKIYVDVEYKYDYLYKQGGITKTFTTTTNYMIFPNGFSYTEGVTPSTYIMYYPNYTFQTSNYDKLDRINIYNRSDVPMNIFLVKQAQVLDLAAGTTMLDTNSTRSQLGAKENVYQVLIKQYFSKNFKQEQVSQNNSLYTNAFINITGSGTIGSGSYKIVSGGNWGSEQIKKITGEVVAQSADVRIWNVRIKIFEHGADVENEEPLYEYTGTKMV